MRTSIIIAIACLITGTASCQYRAVGYNALKGREGMWMFFPARNFVITHFSSRSSPLAGLYGSIIDPERLTPGPKTRLLPSSLENPVDFVDFAFSPDSSKVVLFAINLKEKDDDTSFSLKMLNRDLAVIDSVGVRVPAEVGKVSYAVSDVAVNNKGEVFMLMSAFGSKYKTLRTFVETFDPVRRSFSEVKLNISELIYGKLFATESGISAVGFCREDSSSIGKNYSHTFIATLDEDHVTSVRLISMPPHDNLESNDLENETYKIVQYPGGFLLYSRILYLHGLWTFFRKPFIVNISKKGELKFATTYGSIMARYGFTKMALWDNYIWYDSASHTTNAMFYSKINKLKKSGEHVMDIDQGRGNEKKSLIVLEMDDNGNKTYRPITKPPHTARWMPMFAYLISANELMLPGYNGRKMLLGKFNVKSGKAIAFSK